MMRIALAALLAGWLPGALAFRLPVADRDRRAALAAEERVFWYVVLSVGWSLAAGLTLAVLGLYAFDRLLIVNAAVCALLVLISRARLSFRGAAALPTWTILLPVAIIALGFWRFLPPSEYVIGGQDPGVYLNEGAQIAKSGSIVTRDPTVAAVPAADRDLFYPQHIGQPYYSTRFMGFFIQDPQDGTVIGQFPHVFPISIAMGYDLGGVNGARLTLSVWAVFGLVAVYFAGARLVGPAAAFSAVILLALHVIELWFARVPNAEVVLQALLFATLLAFARAHQDGDRFFALAAGSLAGLLVFLRIDALLVIAGLAPAVVLAWLVDRKAPRAGFVLPLAAAGVLGWLYLTGPLRAYFRLPVIYLQNLPRVPLIAGVVAAVLLVAGHFVFLGRLTARARAALPYVFAGVLVLLAVYAAVFRQPGGRLAPADAYTLRTFVSVYLFWPGFVAALVGLVLVARREFWRDPAFFLVFGTFCAVLFYKSKIFPVHFWMSRRFLPVILPGVLLLVAAAALGRLELGWIRGWRLARVAGGVVLLVVLGWQYVTAAAPLVPHREYEGLIRTVERLSSKFTTRDLVLVEGRDAGSDTHVIGLPLAYIYDRNVLLLFSPRPDKRMLASFLEQALRRYERVLFVGGGGTDLLSRRIDADAVGDGRVQVKEYEVTPWDRYPQGPRRKDFDYTIYQLHLDRPVTTAFVLDVGFEDDLHVVRFHAKEQTEGRYVRWTAPQSFISVRGLTGTERTGTVRHA